MSSYGVHGSVPVPFAGISEGLEGSGNLRKETVIKIQHNKEMLEGFDFPRGWGPERIGSTQKESKERPEGVTWCSRQSTSGTEQTHW